MIYSHLASVSDCHNSPGNHLTKKKIEYNRILHRMLPDLNSEPNTEVGKCETQLEIFRGTAMFCLLLKLVQLSKQIQLLIVGVSLCN